MEDIQNRMKLINGVSSAAERVVSARAKVNT
jgi:hypothetical protein